VSRCDKRHLDRLPRLATTHKRRRQADDRRQTHDDRQNVDGTGLPYNTFPSAKNRHSAPLKLRYYGAMQIYLLLLLLLLLRAVTCSIVYGYKQDYPYLVGQSLRLRVSKFLSQNTCLRPCAEEQQMCSSRPVISCPDPELVGFSQPQ